MTNPKQPIEVRARLADLVEHHNASLSRLSRMLGRNAAYLQQFMTRGTPEKLDEDDRLALAMHFGIDERELGAREPWRPSE